MKNLPMNKETFSKRLGELCLRGGASGFPKDPLDQHILLKSAMLSIDPAGEYSEQEINEKLENWVQQVGQNKDLDRVTMRRRLVDTGYLLRSSDGSSYQVAQPAPKSEWFEADVDQVDPIQAIEAAREEIARRKAEYMAKTQAKK